VSPARRTGYLDESYGRDPGGTLVYVLGFVEVSGDLAELRAILRDLPRKRDGVLHFANEDHDRRTGLAAAVGALGLDLTAVVRRGPDSPARARAVGLTTTAWARRGRIDLLVLESRGSKPDRADARLLSSVHPPEHRIPTRFLRKEDEPVLWVADLVASATFQALARDVPEPLAALGKVDQVDC
jgi:hypothetical protein